MLPTSALLPLLASAVLATPDWVLDTTHDKRQSSYNAAVVEITFYSFIDSTTNANGDCAENCASNGGDPFPESQGIVAHTCSNPDGSPRTNSNGEPTAGGDGTYNNPISAAATGESIISQCQPFWSPYLYKWFIYDDLCPSCNDAEGAHFDLWIGGSASDTGCTSICDCEYSLTPTGGSQFNANNGSAACIFYSIFGDLSVYQPTQTGDLFSGGTCYSDLNTVDSSDNSDLCEVCLVNTNTCSVGDSASIDSPFKKRGGPMKRAVRARKPVPEKTAAPEVAATGLAKATAAAML